MHHCSALCRYSGDDKPYDHTLLIATEDLIDPNAIKNMAAWSEALVCGGSIAGNMASNPAGVMSVCFECRVLSGRGLCDGLITRPEESYRVCVCVCVCVCR
jgi:hypothetical protein